MGFFLVDHFFLGGGGWRGANSECQLCSPLMSASQSSTELMSYFIRVGLSVWISPPYYPWWFLLEKMTHCPIYLGCCLLGLPGIGPDVEWRAWPSYCAARFQALSSSSLPCTWSGSDPVLLGHCWLSLVLHPRRSTNRDLLALSLDFMWDKHHGGVSMSNPRRFPLH